MRTLFLALPLMLVLNGCASKSVKIESPTQNTTATAAVAAAAPATVDDDPVISATTTDAKGVLDRKDLDVYDKVSIALTQGAISLHAAQPGHKGRVRIEKRRGGESCKLYVDETQYTLSISDTPRVAGQLAKKNDSPTKNKLPPRAACDFVVELTLHESAPLEVGLGRGELFIENWKDPIAARVDWGDVDVGMIGTFDLKCGRCTVAGEGISGPLHYALDSGNVGLAGLSSSVEGQTFGDTILKWRKVNPDTAVKLTSQAGDVILFFPAGVAINTSLKALHGEVDARLNSGSRGVPISVVAEAGNVKVYRNR